MGYKLEEPTITTNARDKDREKHTHPAFGVISVTHPSTGGHGTRLFDSAIGHNDFVSITISNASMERNLNQNWIRNEGIVCEFMMSEAQWAQFVASSGMGRGTPITFRTKPVGEYKIDMMPGIAHTESMKQTFEREMKRRCQEYVQDLKDIKSKIETYAASGKATKTQLNELIHTLGVYIGNMPSDMAFTQTQFAAAMEKTTEQAKSDIEAFVTNLAISTGLEELRNRQVQLAALQDRDNQLIIEDDSNT